MMRNHLLTLTFQFVLCAAQAQMEAVVQEGDFGVTFGAGHYFGDLNSRGALNRPKPVVGIHFRKNIGNYIGLRLAGRYAQLGYSDRYSDIEFNRRRNLSFNTNLFELALQGDFHFFRFEPGSDDHFFTPYITFGAGLFNFDPYAYLDGRKYYLRPLGTEGQGTSLFPDRKFYDKMSFCFPLGMGIKYNIRNNVNLTLEMTHRFTRTDYLDDVSTTFAGPLAFPVNADGSPSVAFLLQDRSYETGAPIGSPNRQRGFSAQKDQYLFLEVGLSFSFTSYRCPQ
jgi:opacity protein-like surface antigen